MKDAPPAFDPGFWDKETHLYTGEYGTRVYMSAYGVCLSTKSFSSEAPENCSSLTERLCLLVSVSVVKQPQNVTLSECQKGRVVKTTYQHFPLDGRPCQNARWVVLTPCENSPFVSECIVALYRNSTLSALDGYIMTLEIAAYAQHWHSDPEWSTLDTDIRSKWS